ncbi:hypothetical protein G6F56_011256 [Rhizopus delemar]|nr:hypothetical protein G6F56_011256 [Rhizopus delemar]
MSLISSVSGFAAFGVLVRTYALGLQKRPIFSNPSGHAIAAAAFGSFGYFVFNLQERQSAAIAAKKEVMVQNRKRAEELAALA